MALLAGLLLLSSGCEAKLSTNSLSSFPAVTQPAGAETSQPSTGLPVSLHVATSTLEEASQITGYRVLGPTNLPDGFSRYGDIDVIKSRADVSYSVVQRWAWDQDSSVLIGLPQDPELDGIIGGSPVQIGRRTGQRALHRAVAGKPARLELYWKDGDMAFVLWGVLAGPLDESTVYDIALSVGPN